MNIKRIGNAFPKGNSGYPRFGKDNPSWKGGKPKCKDCGKTLVNRYAKRCKSCWHIFCKGKNHFNFGKKKINPISPLSCAIRVLNNYSDWRTKIFQRDNYACQECGQVGGKLEADHIVSFCKLFKNFLKENYNLDIIKDRLILLGLAERYLPFWDTTNGRTLCKPCHKITPNYGSKGRY